jgi:hypothetical protein
MIVFFSLMKFSRVPRLTEESLRQERKKGDSNKGQRDEALINVPKQLVAYHFAEQKEKQAKQK